MEHTSYSISRHLFFTYVLLLVSFFVSSLIFRRIFPYLEMVLYMLISVFYWYKKNGKEAIYIRLKRMRVSVCVMCIRCKYWIMSMIYSRWIIKIIMVARFLSLRII